jgi:hypothetical protein
MYVYGMRAENDITFGAEKARDSSREREGAFLAAMGVACPRGPRPFGEKVYFISISCQKRYLIYSLDVHTN